MTSKELAATLRGCGYPISARRITDWVAKGLLPKRERVRRRPGEGRGALYRWSQSDVATQALTVHEALAVHRSADLAALATWFAGFEYPVERMRSLWSEVEEGQWIDALEFGAGGS